MAESLLQGAGLIKPTATRYSPAATRYSPDSPEGMINQQAALMRKQIQTEFQTEWDSLRGRVSGQDRHKAKYAMDELHERFRGRMTRLNQDVEQKLSGLFTKPDKPADPMAEFGKLDVIRNKIRSRLDDFQVVPAGEIPSRLRASRDVSKWIGLSPALTVAHRLWPKEKVAPAELQVFDPTLIGYDDKGKEKRGDHRKATPGEMEEFKTLKRGEEWAAAKGREHMSGMLRSAINSPRQVGSVSQQMGAYLDRKQGATGQSQQSGKYTMGQVINQGGKSYKIVGFDTDGEPLVEENR